MKPKPWYELSKAEQAEIRKQSPEWFRPDDKWVSQMGFWKGPSEFGRQDGKIIWMWALKSHLEARMK